MLAVAQRLSPFDRPVTDYMASDVVTTTEDTLLADVVTLMDAWRVSCTPVVDGRGALVGVVSRMDLVALGAQQSGARRESPAMPLPRRRVGDIMTKRVFTLPVSATIRC